MRELPGFWVACRSPEVPSDPLTVSVPGLGPRAHADDPRTQREGGSDVEYTSPDPGLVSGPPAPD
jgi:hypothetical protein